MQKKLVLILENVDMQNIEEEKLSNLLIEAFEKQGYSIQDKPAVIREGKISSLRAVEKSSMEEVEIYALAKTLKKKDILKTVISASII